MHLYLYLTASRDAVQLEETVASIRDGDGEAFGSTEACDTKKRCTRGPAGGSCDGIAVGRKRTGIYTVR